MRKAMRNVLSAFVWLCLVAPAWAGPGEKMYNEFVEAGQIYQDEAWQSYVRQIGARLLVETPDAKKRYTFTVLDNSQINAFATPDAYIFINRGLISYLRSEDELAAVIGHEIGHVVGRHSRRQKSANMMGQSVGMMAAIFTGRGELMDLSNAAVTTMVSGYGREMELEADRYGGEFIARAGYNPLAMIDVVQVLKDQELFSKQVANRPSNYHGLFATHPKNDKRLYEVVAYAQNMLPDEVSAPIADFWEMVDGLVYGEQASGGIVRDSTYYHGGLRVVVEFPEGWAVADGQTEVMARAPGGSDEAVITVGRLDPQKKTTPEQYVSKVLQREVMQGESVEINGMASYVGELSVEGTDKKKALLAVMYKGNHVYLFKGEAGPNGDVDEFTEEFLATLATLRTMNAADMQMANNHRIKVQVAKPGETYADLAASAPIKQWPEETLRLLNGGHPHGEPRAGDYIKVVQ